MVGAGIYAGLEPGVWSVHKIPPHPEGTIQSHSAGVSTEGVGPSKGSEGRYEGSGMLRGERCSPKRTCDPGAQTGDREVF